MPVVAEIRRRARHIVAPLIAAAVVGYFGYHAVNGERGLIAWLQVTQQIKQAQATLEEVRAKRGVLEHRVALLRSESLDPDMLDERARIMLNLAGPDEVIVLEAAGENSDNWMVGESTAPTAGPSSGKTPP